LAAVAVVALAGAVFLYRGLWADVHHSYLGHQGGDQNLFEWFFAAVAQNLTGLHNPLQSMLENAPAGVNLMANAAMLGVAIPLAPVTLLFGPQLTYALVMTLGLALTTTAWYWLFSRRLVQHRAAAVVAAAFCGFAPPVLSHANAHANFVFAPLIPLIIDRTLRLAGGHRVRRDGIVLGLLAAYQIYLGEEILLITGIGMVLYAIGYALTRPATARHVIRPLTRGFGLGAAVALTLTAPALYWQFRGPGSYGNAIYGGYNPGNPPRDFVAFPSQSLVGHGRMAGSFNSWTEQNALFGRPLIVLGAALAILLWKHTTARAATVMTLGAALLSMGPTIPLPGGRSVPGPWRMLAERPLFDSILVTRLSLICVPGLAILLAVAVERLSTQTDRRVQLAGFGSLAAALVPILPTPYPVTTRPQPPALITTGDWHSYVRPGHTLVIAPLPSGFRTDPQDWAVRADLGFALAGGYFRGPDPTGKQALYTSIPRPTAELFDQVQKTGQPIQPDPTNQAAIRTDLDYWRADALMIDPTAAQEPLRRTIEGLLGRPPELVDGVLIWRLADSGQT
jgi:dolichyl-phosphate beta-glucosyltransferase